MRINVPEQNNASKLFSVLQTSSTRIPGTVIPPPLVRGGQQTSSKLGTQQNTQIVMPPLVRGAQVSIYLVVDPLCFSLMHLNDFLSHLSPCLEGTCEVLAGIL